MNDRKHFEERYFEEIDSLSECDNYFVPILQEVAKVVDVKEATVLDVGCGTGLFMAPMVSWGCVNLYGVDGITAVAERAIARGYSKVATVEDLSYTALPFVDKTFDLVVCKDVLEHLMRPEFTLGEILRVLKDNGKCLIHVPNHFPLYGRLKFLFSNDIDTFGFFPGASRWNFPHIRFFEYREFVAVLKKNGFSVESDLSHHFAVAPLISKFKLSRPLINFLASRFPNQFVSGFTLLLSKD